MIHLTVRFSSNYVYKMHWEWFWRIRFIIATICLCPRWVPGNPNHYRLLLATWGSLSYKCFEWANDKPMCAKFACFSGLRHVQSFCASGKQDDACDHRRQASVDAFVPVPTRVFRQALRLESRRRCRSERRRWRSSQGECRIWRRKLLSKY